MTTVKEFLDVPFEVKAVDEKGNFSGYGSLFTNEPDSGGDVIEKGAFNKSLNAGGRNKTGIAMLWQHRPDSIPGVWTQIEEDAKGLRVRGKLALNTQLGKDIYEIMKLGMETGTFKLSLSIGYDAIDFDRDPKTRIRTLKEVSLWEISLVTFGMRLGATVEAVKAAATVRGLESQLRDILSKNAAMYVVSLCRPFLKEEKPSELFENESDLSLVLKTLKTINKNIASA